MTRLIYNALMNEKEDNPLRMIEELIERNVAADKETAGKSRQRRKNGRQPRKLSQTTEEVTVLLMGAYYGLINHYHLHGKEFDAGKMKREMRRMIDAIIE